MIFMWWETHIKQPVCDLNVHKVGQEKQVRSAVVLSFFAWLGGQITQELSWHLQWDRQGQRWLGFTFWKLMDTKCRHLTCKVHPKTPIMSIAMHRYSVKTSHHGFRTLYFELGSVPRDLNSPTGIILAAAPHWWKETKGKERVDLSNEAGTGFQCREVSRENLVKGFKVTWHKEHTWALAVYWPWMNGRSSCAQRGIQTGWTSLTTKRVSLSLWKEWKQFCVLKPTLIDKQRKKDRSSTVL